MTIDALIKPKTADSYSHLTKGGNFNVELNQETQESDLALE